MHEVLVNRLGGLSLPRKSVVRLTDHPDTTLDVYHGSETTIQQQLLSVRLVEYMSKFLVRVSLSGYIDLSNHSSESIHICTMGTIEALLPCHEFWPTGLCLRWDLRSKSNI